MTYLDLVISGLYQGLVMIWPVSGDIVVNHLFTWSADPAVGILIKAICGIGAGLALVLVLHNDLYTVTRSAWVAAKRRQDGSARIFFALLIGAAPLVVMDILSVQPLVLPTWLSGTVLILSGLALFTADKLGVTVRDLDHLSILTYLIIGVMQAGGTTLGIAPQIISVVIARLMGCERDQAARLALLLLIPHLLIGLGGFTHDTALPPATESLLTGTIAFCASLVGASVLLRWLRRHGFGVFAITQIAIGALTILSVTRFGG